MLGGVLGDDGCLVDGRFTRRDAVGVEIRHPVDAGQTQGGCRGARDRGACQRGDVRASGERHDAAHGATIRPGRERLTVRSGRTWCVVSPRPGATRPGCEPDLPDAPGPRNLLLVRPTGKSEGPEGLAPSSGEPPQPKPLSRENKAFWSRMGSHSSKLLKSATLNQEMEFKVRRMGAVITASRDFCGAFS